MIVWKIQMSESPMVHPTSFTKYVTMLRKQQKSIKLLISTLFKITSSSIPQCLNIVPGFNSNSVSAIFPMYSIFVLLSRAVSIRFSKMRRLRGPSTLVESDNNVYSASFHLDLCLAIIATWKVTKWAYEYRCSLISL